MDALNSTTALPVITSTVSPQVFPLYAGYIACAIAVIFYGSNFVPVKKFETGDGMFFQWILCSAIFLCGLIVQLARDCPTFYSLPMVGGVLWATGNICVVPIVKTIGLGLGILIWGTLNMLSGWASSRFGWFGMKPELPVNDAFNYAGVACAILRGLIFLFVKNEADLSVTDRSDSDRQYLLFNAQQDVNSVSGSRTSLVSNTRSSSSIERLSPVKKRIIGISLSIFSGTLYGLTFAPTIYIQDNYKGASQNGLDYVFAYFCGIYATSTFYFILYAAISKNKPRLYPCAILPALASGTMWGAATLCWFVANSTLSETISFPIVTTVPGIIAAAWGLLFKEIRGWKNYLILGVAFIITIAGAVLTGLSKLKM